MSAPKKTKLGKTRLDKFYYLAKEQGYRSRAAFKLIQLNKKYGFLEHAKAVLDLCAAPGSWMQVAKKAMPMSSTLVGIDLDPIKAIGDAHCIQGDITTEKAKNDIKKALGNWKVDVCLHDGAPNVGMAWNQDAFQQADLVLASLRLATTFLIKGGWFVTKVFRSAEYNSLLWVFNQLFEKVQATKPTASRNTSAEIFVVCRGYLDPKKIDPKLLDSRYVFKELSEPSKSINVFAKKIKPNREGYEEGNFLQHKKTTVSAFFESEDPVTMFGTYNQIEWDPEAIKQYGSHKETTNEIKALLQDLKLCSKPDFRNLVRWRAKLLREKEIKEEAEKPKPEEQPEVELSEEQKEAMVDSELSERMQKIEHDKKLKLKKFREKKQKHQRKVDAGMVIQGDNIDQVDDALFNIKRDLKDATTEELEKLTTEIAPELDPDYLDPEYVDPEAAYQMKVNGPEVRILDRDEEDAANEEQFEREYREGLERQRGNAARLKLARMDAEKAKNKKMQKKLDMQLAQINDMEIPEGPVAQDGRIIPRVSGPVFEDTDDMDTYRNPLIVTDGSVAPSISKRASMWFSGPMFAENEEDDVDSEDDAPMKIPIVGKKRKSAAEDTDDEDDGYDTDEELRRIRASQANGKKAKDSRDDKKDKNKKSKKEEVKEESEEEEGPKRTKRKKSGGDDFEVVPQQIFDEPEQDDDESDFEVKEDKIEALAIGSMLMNDKKMRAELIDNAYNRYAFNDSDLPTWFEHDERANLKANVPLTKEHIEEARLRAKALDARPIKKVAEARARKKLKAQKVNAKIAQQAQSVADASDLTPAQKTKQIEELYRKRKTVTKFEKNYVVMRKFMGGSVKKGMTKPGKRLTLVDPRMKKDKMIKKNKAKAQKKRRN